MLELLCPIFGRVSITRFQTNPRSADPETLLPFVKQAVVEKQDSVESALESALESQLIVAAGSFYLAGEVYNWLSKVRN